MDEQKLDFDNFYKKGMEFANKNEYGLAMKYIDRCVDIAEHEKNPTYTFKSCYGMGVIKLRLGAHRGASKLFSEAEKHIEKVDDIDAIIDFYTTLGNLKAEWDHDLNGSIEYYKKAEKLLPQAKNIISKTKLLNNLGSVYYDIGKYENSIKYLKEVLNIELLDSGDELKEKINGYVNAGRTYIELNDLEKAEEYTKVSEKLINKLDNIDSEFLRFNAGINYAHIHKCKEQWNRAIETMNNSYNEFCNNIEQKYPSHRCLVDFFDACKEKELGLIYDYKFKKTGDEEDRKNAIRDLTSAKKTYIDIGHDWEAEKVDKLLANL